jgi:hypothetical protein
MVRALLQSRSWLNDPKRMARWAQFFSFLHVALSLKKHLEVAMQARWLAMPPRAATRHSPSPRVSNGVIWSCEADCATSDHGQRGD